MREGWKSKPLGEVATFLNGLWKGEKPPYVTVGVIRNTNFAKDGSIDDSDIAWLEVEAKKFEKRRLEFGDIILEKSGGGPKQPVGRVALFEKNEGDYSFSNFTSAIRVNDAKELEFRFLHKFLFWKYASGVTKSMQSHSTGIRNLNAEAYKAIEVPLPPLPEQQRIVAVLDEAFAGLAIATANAEKNLKNARELFGSFLNSVFAKEGDGRTQRTLSDLCNGMTVGHVGPMATRYKSNGIPFLRSQNIRPFEVDLNEVVFIDDEFHRSLAKSQLRPGDVAIVRTGYPGTAAVIPNELGELNCADLVIVHPGNEIMPEYIAAFFNSSYGKRLVSGAAVGAAQKHFNVTAAKAVKISLPTSDEQNRIVKDIGAMRYECRILESGYQKKLVNLGALRQSILHRAFSGELTSAPFGIVQEAAE